MLVATYDFWGYYNVTFLGEVKDPARTVPRGALLAASSPSGLTIPALLPVNWQTQ